MVPKMLRLVLALKIWIFVASPIINISCDSEREKRAHSKFVTFSTSQVSDEFFNSPILKKFGLRNNLKALENQLFSEREIVPFFGKENRQLKFHISDSQNVLPACVGGDCIYQSSSSYICENGICKYSSSETPVEESSDINLYSSQERVQCENGNCVTTYSHKAKCYAKDNVCVHKNLCINGVVPREMVQIHNARSHKECSSRKETCCKVIDNCGPGLCQGLPDFNQQYQHITQQGGFNGQISAGIGQQQTISGSQYENNGIYGTQHQNNENFAQSSGNSGNNIPQYQIINGNLVSNRPIQTTTTNPLSNIQFSGQNFQSSPNSQFLKPFGEYQQQNKVPTLIDNVDYGTVSTNQQTSLTASQAIASQAAFANQQLTFPGNYQAPDQHSLTSSPVIQSNKPSYQQGASFTNKQASNFLPSFSSFTNSFIKNPLTINPKDSSLFSGKQNQQNLESASEATENNAAILFPRNPPRDEIPEHNNNNYLSKGQSSSLLHDQSESDMDGSALPGCAAASRCVAASSCTADGIIVDTPVYGSSERTHVPLTDCYDAVTGVRGKCCRDSKYGDRLSYSNEGSSQRQNVKVPDNFS